MSADPVTSRPAPIRAAWRLALVGAATLTLTQQGAQAQSLASETPQIPEPMVFDLLRPLGARAGEREVNVLTVRPGRFDQPTSWAPELEYAYADGQSLEVELPFEDGRLTQYKFALQGTFGIGAQGRFIHGWQYIGLYDRERAQASNALLYIAGYRFDPRWSALGLMGLRKDGVQMPGPTFLLVNPTLFYDLDAATVLGLEVNLRQGLVLDDTTRMLVIPQVHRRLGGSTTLQIGLGMQFETRRDSQLIAAMRIIREF